MSPRAGNQREVLPAGDERGQVAVETVAMVVLVVFTMGLMWQAILTGYSVMLASRAADQAARETAVQMPSLDANDLGAVEGVNALPDAWQSNADVEVTTSADVPFTTDGPWARAEVSVQVPLVVPGWQSIPVEVSASSEARP